MQRADWVVLGPGSWFTSVIPHLLVPELCRAVVDDPRQGSWSSSTSPRRTARPPASSRPTTWPRCCEHAPDLRMHTVLADVRSVPDRESLEAAVTAAGARLVVADIAAADGSARHDPGKLAAAYDGILAPDPRG